jgi:hypothetical protein
VFDVVIYIFSLAQVCFQNIVLPIGMADLKAASSMVESLLFISRTVSMFPFLVLNHQQLS